MGSMSLSTSILNEQNHRKMVSVRKQMKKDEKSWLMKPRLGFLAKHPILGFLLTWFFTTLVAWFYVSGRPLFQGVVTERAVPHLIALPAIIGFVISGIFTVYAIFEPQLDEYVSGIIRCWKGGDE